MIGQRKKTIWCATTSDLRGKNILITGRASGVGEFVSRGLIVRGATVTSLARSLSQSSDDLTGLTSIKIDLGDPSSVLCATEQCGSTPSNAIIFNACINSSKYEQTTEGRERTFAVNVFGHHLLFQALRRNGLIKPGARVIFTTGNIYVLANECTSNFVFKAGPMAYARSNLGNLWQVVEIARRYPDIDPIAVHPGVVLSGFAGSKTGISGWLKDRIFISEETGAQASLIAVAQPIDRGSYGHNVFGRVDLTQSDIAMDTAKSGQLWDTLEDLAHVYQS